MKTSAELLKILDSKGIRLTLDREENLVVRGNKQALDSQLVAELKANKHEVVTVLRAYQQKKSGSSILPTERNQQDYPTSFAQQRLWFIDKMEGGARQFNIAQALHLHGDLNQQALTAAFTAILERHESLRTCFAQDASGEPRQKIQPARPLHIAIDDITDVPEADKPAVVAHQLAQEAALPFDLASDLMIRARLLKLAAQEHLLLITMHHIASDGWSMAVMIKEFTVFYCAAIAGRQPSLPALPVQYLDYAAWQRKTLSGDALTQQLNYWSTQLQGIPEVHSLPLDYPRPAQQTFDGTVLSTQLNSDVSRCLKTLCQREGVTLFMGLHAAFSTFLARLSNERDIVVGTTIANREQAEIAGLIGFFVNNLVLRTRFETQSSFTDLLRQSKHTLLEAYAHQQVPFEQVVEQLRPERSLSHSPLFQVMLILQNNDSARFELPGLTMDVVEQDQTLSKYDLTLSIVEGADGLGFNWEFNTALFRSETVACLAEQFNQFIATLVARPADNVFALNILTVQSRDQILNQWNATQTSLPEDCRVHKLFEQQATKSPDNIALVFERQEVTYFELNQRANQLAQYLLRHRSVILETPVGICMARGIDMIVAVLAVLKAGGAYVPLDPDYPQARLEFMQQDSRLHTVLTHRRYSHQLQNSDAACCLDDADLQQLVASMPLANLDNCLADCNLAYLIYTSGSTGQPKASLLEHRGLANLALGQIDGFCVEQNSRVLQFASPAFDAATSEIFMALLRGATLVIPSNETVKSAAAISDLVCEQRVTHATLPPALLPLLDITRWDSVSTLIVAGDSCALDQARRWSRGRQFINAYGPSETTVCATLGTLDAEDHCLHIGKPIQNVQVYVLNDCLQPAGVGCAGELYIGGVGLSRGYLNRDDLTEDKFVANPFHNSVDPSSSPRLYRTGDLARWLPSGKLEFLGRIDHQIKIRGFRIELGEIENALRELDCITDALVLAVEFAEGDKRLMGYVVPTKTLADDDQESLVETLRVHLAARLPEYMLPAAYIALEAFPLTANGKVDRKALPDPHLTQVTVAYVAPKTATERRLCAIWQEILGVERIGISDNFFHRGGHSLLVLKLLRALEQEFNVQPNLKMMFQFPDLQNLAAYLEVLQTQITVDAIQETESYQI